MEPRPEPADLLDAFARTSDAVFAVDEAMRVVFWNGAAERIFALDATDAIGRRCDEIVGGLEPNGISLCHLDCRVISCSRRGYAAETYDLVRNDDRGERQWLNVSIVVLRGRRRASTLTVHLVRDVTQTRRTEQRADEVLTAISTPVRRFDGADITKREADVLRLLACGLSNAAMAETLGISQTTVRNHIEHLLSKLGVHSKLEAVVYAARTGLISDTGEPHR